MKKILVLGGTGFIGRNLCEELAKNGFAMTVPTRRVYHARCVQHLQHLNIVETDIQDESRLAALVAGHDAVVNLVGILHGSDKAFNEVHVVLARKLAAACQTARVRRVIHVSCLGQSDNPPSRYLRSKTEGEALLPRALPQLRETFPKLQLYLREDQTARLLERLNAGELDAVLLALPYALGDLEVMDLGEDRFSVVYPADHRLPASGVATPADIASENLLLLEDGHCLRDQALAACELESARRNTAFNGTSLHTLAQMVANGLGVTLMPQMALDAGIVRGLDVAVRPMADGTSHRRIGLVWRRTSARKETFRRLGEALRPFL